MNDDASIVDPLVVETTKKASIIWVKPDPSTAVAKALWCTWIDDALCVVCGPGEQDDPGLAESHQCRVIVRGDHNGRVVDFAAEVIAVPPDCEYWEPVTGTLATKRLNSTASDIVAWWASECRVYRLVPAAQPPLRGADLPAESLAAQVEPSEATRLARKPFQLFRRRRVSRARGNKH